ncbi:MAG TPA: hypothetical protein VHV51_11805 [Polyangiaceae bacterium]|jgi:Spy/CpxP family protein refolding chaperone|nr:hypothetical protein [Polyangiaceae bacterium]
MAILHLPLGRRVVALIALASALGANACASQHAAAPPPTSANAAQSAADDDEASGLLEHHRFHHHGGVTLFIAMSLDTLGLPQNERAAVEKIRQDLHTHMQPALAADQSLVATLADGLDAGNIDTSKVDSEVSQLATAAAAAHDASSDALNELHNVLTPPERAALVDKVEAHWAVWQRANAEASATEHAEKGHLATLTANLGLTPEQTNRIRQTMSESMKGVPRVDAQEATTELHAFGDAFESDKFDAKSLSGTSKLNAHLASWGAAHLAHFIEAASPVLSAEQRATLAQHLREHAGHNPSAEAQGAT